MIDLLPERQPQVVRKADGAPVADMACGKASAAGSVSQRACVFCGSRVVLYPISDALHIVHGPIGCAAYTWDIRGALSSGPQLHRNSFSTDLQEMDVIFGGEKKLEAALLELIAHYKPQAAFIYSTCIVGLIGDDVSAVCRRVAEKTGIPVLPVHSEGFKGTKKDGYRAACEAVYKLVGTGDTAGIGPHSINILGEFNLAGETWILRDYYKRMGIEVVACITGDSRIEDIRRCHGAKLNLVQCSGSMTHLAKMMERDHGIPFKRVSYFGIEDMSAALYEAAKYFGDDPAIMLRAQQLVREEIAAIYPELQRYKQKLVGKKSGDLRRRRVQGVFPRSRLAPARHGNRGGWLADWRHGGLSPAPGNLRSGDHYCGRLQSARTGEVLFGKGRGLVHWRCEGAAHRLQARHWFLRS
jgi:nitrogenase molybdenum-cofactor synthesis protein NifE